MGAGPLWVGGLAFAAEGGAEAQWASLPPALLVLPELLLSRGRDGTFLTLCALAGGDTEPRDDHGPRAGTAWDAQ